MTQKPKFSIGDLVLYYSDNKIIKISQVSSWEEWWPCRGGRRKAYQYWGQDVAESYGEFALRKLTEEEYEQFVAEEL